MSNITLPTPQPLLSRTGWAAWLAALIVLCALVPAFEPQWCRRAACCT